jgi:hypothetical protein
VVLSESLKAPRLNTRESSTTMQDADFRAYVSSVVALMPGWEIVKDQRVSPRARLTGTTAEIYFPRDDSKKRFSAVADTSRMVEGRNTWVGDEYKASAGFAQGRDPGQVARAVLAKVADAAKRASEALDKLEAQARESRSDMLSAIDTLNASKLLSRPISKPADHDQGAHFYAKGARGYVNHHGSVRFDRLDVDAATAARILAILAERGE